MRHATALLYHVCAVASRNIRFASCGTSGKLTLWTRYVLHSFVKHSMSFSSYCFVAVIRRMDPLMDRKLLIGATSHASVTSLPRLRQDWGCSNKIVSLILHKLNNAPNLKILKTDCFVYHLVVFVCMRVCIGLFSCAQACFCIHVHITAHACPRFCVHCQSIRVNGPVSLSQCLSVCIPCFCAQVREY
jgi:hypothetical protein